MKDWKQDKTSKHDKQILNKFFSDEIKLPSRRNLNRLKQIPFFVLTKKSIIQFENKQFNPAEDFFVGSMKNVLESLSKELKIISDQNIKLIEIKRGENIQEKLNLLQEYYFTGLKSEFNLSALIDYISKIRVLNGKVGEI